MWKGSVVAIHIADDKGADPHPVSSAVAVVGKGLEGDRIFRHIEAGKAKPNPEREVTFIETEALEGLQREYGIELSPADSRRNILTEKVPLNHLVGRQFRAGDCTFEGMRLCEPCNYLEGKTRKGVREGLIHRGGLRARVVSGGTVRVGDAVEGSK